MIKTWVILVSGFTQGPRRENGTERLWRYFRSHVNSKTCVVYRIWDDDAEGFADYVKRNSVIPTENGRARVVVAAYSWGAGHFFTRFARRCLDIGVDIDVAVLCDPVYRSRTLPLRWLSLTRLPSIRIPASVLMVHSLLQKVNRPRAHRLKMDSQRTKVRDPIKLNLRHQDMDHAEAYHRIVKSAFAELLRPEFSTGA